MILWKDSVTDRTISDVKKLRDLLTKGYEAFTDEEKMEWQQSLKGALNISDLYRIKNNIEVLRETLELDIQRVELGSNLIPFPYAGFQTSKNGLTATVNQNGSITISGTATADTSFKIVNAKTICNAGSRYFLSGCPMGGSSQSFCLRVESDSNFAEDYGAGAFFNPGSSSANSVQILIKANSVMRNVTFWPMICWTDENGEYDHVYEKYRSDRNIFLPKAAVFEEIRTNVESIRSANGIHSDTPETPTRPFNTFQKWNDLEKILEDVYEILMDNFSYLTYAGGEIFCGEGIGFLI